MKKAALLFALTLLAALLPTGVANAATCRDAACDGKGPSATGCEVGAVTLAYGGHGEELRWSSTCRSFWARDDRPSFWSTEVSIERWIGNSRVQIYTEEVEPGSGYDWTLMIGNRSGSKYRACYRDPQQSGSTTCTAFKSYN